tara:strand:+ start:828 stop:998 length:171 start_codon:yes stop_codon:yes gene_type:complete
MSSKKTNPKDSSAEAKSSNLKVHKDFKEFGRITSENLNDYFDVDLMAAAQRKRRKR